MSHTIKDKKKLGTRVRRIKGQIEAIERSLDSDEECEVLLQQVASCRGALNGLMTELIEGHLRFHVLPEDGSASAEQNEAADELMAIVKRYLS